MTKLHILRCEHEAQSMHINFTSAVSHRRQGYADTVPHITRPGTRPAAGKSGPVNWT